MLAGHRHPSVVLPWLLPRCAWQSGFQVFLFKDDEDPITLVELL